jgi:hypothetical protein
MLIYKIRYMCVITILAEFMIDFRKQLGAGGSVMVKALRYKPEGRGFETRWGEFLNLPNPSGRIRPWGSLSL